MGIRDEDLDAGLFEAFQAPADESALQAIQRLHGTGSSVLLRDASEDISPILLRSDQNQVRDDARYKILGEIARGGIGVVYKAHDNDLNRDVALKVLRPEYADREDVIQRFVEEAQVEGQLQHPGIVPIYGLGLQPDGRPSFVMKLIKGKTLAELLDDNPAGIDLLAVFEQVTQAMAYAHSRGVIHRDLKPANVMVGAFGEVQVVDWGFAKVLGREEVMPKESGLTVVTTVRSDAEGSQSIAGSVMGTPAYMPPEQAMGRISDLDERSDVFALGAILCEILTGKPPYIGEQKDQLIAAMQSRLDPAYERLEETDAAQQLKAITRECLSPLAGERPSDAGVLAEKLAAHFAGVEERARQAQLDAVASESQAAHERYKRRRALVLAAAAMVAIVAGGGGYLWWQNNLADREATARPQIAAALREATGHEGQGDWASAAAKAREAVDLAASAGIADGGAAVMLASFEQRQQAADDEAAQGAADQELLNELEEIRLRRSDEYTGHGRIVSFSPRAADAAYTAAIERRWPGLAVDTRRLRDSENALAFASAFDAWAHMRRTEKSLAESYWQKIDGWARAVDPEHDELRTALVADDPALLVETAVSDEVLELPPALLATIGTVLLDAGRREEAENLLFRAARRYPGDSWIHHRIAESARLRLQLGLAVRHYTATLARRPRSVEVRHRLGGCLQQRREYERAIAVFRAGLDVEPGWGHAYAHIGQCQAALGQLDDAEASFEKARAEASDDTYVLGAYGTFLNNHRRRYAEAAALHREVLELDDANSLDWRNLGVTLLALREFDDAIAAYRESLTRTNNPSALADAHSQIGHCLFDKGDPEGAQAECDKALANVEEHAPAWNLRGCVLWSQSRFREAGEAFDRAIAAGSRMGEVWSNRARVHHVTGKELKAVGKWRQARSEDLEAVAKWRRALELGADSVLLREGLGATLCDWFGEYDEAIEHFRAGHVLDPEDNHLVASIGVAYRKKGDYDKAETWLRKAVEMKPKDGPSRRTLGDLYKVTNRIEAALEQYSEAITIDSKDAKAHAQRGSMLRRMGKARDAVEPLERALSLGIEIGWKTFVNNELGLAKEDLGLIDEAIAHYHAALSTANEDAKVEVGENLDRAEAKR